MRFWRSSPGVGLFLVLGSTDGSDRDMPGRDASPAESGASDGPTANDPVLKRSTCPADLANCVVASDRVIYVEKVDPDGDGDAHFVTASSEGVTTPGITIFDVRSDL